jgi:tRNA(fMet)-specific endonuclease VapC
MLYVLDTDILSLLAHKDSEEAPRIHRRIAELSANDKVVTTIISYEEQMRGWMAALSRAKTIEATIAVYGRLLHHLLIFRHMTVMPFDRAAAMEAERLRAHRLQIGAMDLRIAAIVMSTGGVLVTRNTRDFRSIPAIRFEDWSSENA